MRAPSSNVSYSDNSLKGKMQSCKLLKERTMVPLSTPNAKAVSAKSTLATSGSATNLPAQVRSNPQLSDALPGVPVF